MKKFIEQIDIHIAVVGLLTVLLATILGPRIAQMAKVNADKVYIVVGFIIFIFTNPMLLTKCLSPHMKGFRIAYFISNEFLVFMLILISAGVIRFFGG